jgi:long-chain fatty acid transport protein
MCRRSNVLAPVLALAVAGLAAAPAVGAGFGIFEQGSKAMGMAGAFTAQADDPSALFHNPAGIAFQKERDFAVGFTWIQSTEAGFEGSAAGFPGPGVTAEQETLSEFPPHAYWVQPLNRTWTFGLGVMTPFGLTTEWQDVPTFTGRFISHFASLTAIDVNPTLGWQATPNFGIAVGAIGRFSTVELKRDIPQFNPFTQTVADIATLHLEGDLDNQGYGWNAGILHKVGDFSWGLSYRAPITVDYEGDSELTQNLTNTPFDALVRNVLPFDTTFPVETGIDFPAMASLGLAYQLTPGFLAEVDFNWTGWSSFEDLEINFPDGQLPSSTIPEEYEDANNYRLGLRWDTSPANQWRAGVVFDETPQPEQAVSPLLPDSDRWGFTLGYGHQGGVDFDVALMYLIFDERTRDQTFPGEEASAFFGTYNQEAVLLGLTLGF